MKTTDALRQTVTESESQSMLMDYVTCMRESYVRMMPGQSDDDWTGDHEQEHDGQADAQQGRVPER
jgi:hypothetical protein